MDVRNSSSNTTALSSSSPIWPSAGAYRVYYSENDFIYQSADTKNSLTMKANSIAAKEMGELKKLFVNNKLIDRYPQKAFNRFILYYIKTIPALNGLILIQNVLVISFLIFSRYRVIPKPSTRGRKAI